MTRKSRLEGKQTSKLFEADEDEMMHDASGPSPDVIDLTNDDNDDNDEDAETNYDAPTTGPETIILSSDDEDESVYSDSDCENDLIPNGANTEARSSQAQHNRAAPQRQTSFSLNY